MLTMSFENMKYFCVIFVFNSKIVIHLDVEKKSMDTSGQHRGFWMKGCTHPLNINRSRPSQYSI